MSSPAGSVHDEEPGSQAPKVLRDSELQPTRSDGVTLAAPPSRAPLTVPSLVRLQSLAGNAAVAALLQRGSNGKNRPYSSPPPAPRQASSWPAPPLVPAAATQDLASAQSLDQLAPNFDDVATASASLAAAPPRAPEQVAELARAGYNALEERARTEARVAQLAVRAQESQQSILGRSQQERKAITDATTGRCSQLRQAAARERHQIAADFAGHRTELQAGVDTEVAGLTTSSATALQSIEGMTTTRVSALTADLEARRGAMHERLQFESRQPAVFFEAEVVRAQQEVGAAAAEARRIGEAEAGKYKADETGQVQASAARKVARETADDIAKKGPGISEELRKRIPEATAKHHEFGGGLDQLLTDCLPQMSRMLQDEAAAAVTQVHTVCDSGVEGLRSQEGEARSHLDAAEKQALSRVRETSASSLHHLNSLGKQAEQAIEAAAQARIAELNAHVQAVTGQLIAAERPDRQAVDETVAAATTYLDGAVGEFGVQAEKASSSTVLALDQGIIDTQAGLAKLVSQLATQDRRAVTGVLAHIRSAAQSSKDAAQRVVAGLAQHQQSLVAEGLAEIDGIIQKGLAEPAKFNDQVRSEAAKARTEAVAKAREPLGPLSSNVRAAAEKAKEEHERSLFAKIAIGIGKALLGILIGLVIVVALAVVIAFLAGAIFGVALTAFGAMMIAGGLLLLIGLATALYRRHTDPKTAKLGIGEQIKFALADVTGVTALCEAVFDQDVVTGNELNLSTEDRWERGTTGTLSIVMLVLGARGLRAAPYTRPIGLPAVSLSSGLIAARGVTAELGSSALLGAKAARDWVATGLKSMTGPKPVPVDKVPLARPIGPGDVVTPDRVTAGGPDTGAPTTTGGAKDAIPDKDAAPGVKTGPAGRTAPELAKSLREVCRGRGDPVGLKKVDFIERASGKLLTDELKADFFNRVQAKLDADPTKLPWDAMKDVVKDDPGAFLYKGDKIDPDVIRQHGGMARGVDVDSVWGHMLTDDAKLPYRVRAQQSAPKGVDPTSWDAADLDARAKALWLQDLQKDPSILDLSKLRMDAVLTNPKSVGWWIPRDEFAQYSLVELIIDMALKRDVYQPGMVVFTVDADAAGASGFHKPTPFDGIVFREWGEASPGSVFGVTEGGIPEAVAPPKINVSQVEPGGLQVFPPSGPIALPAGVGATQVSSDAHRRTPSAPAGVP